MTGTSTSIQDQTPRGERAATPGPLLLAFGLPRSGTTWIGKIFDSHPGTLYRHEPDSGGVLDVIPLVVPVERVARYRAVLESFVRELPACRTAKVVGSVPVFPKTHDGLLGFPLRRVVATVARGLGDAFERSPLGAWLGGTRPHGAHLVWKSIESVGRLGLIARSFPRSRAILILRHPCAYVASILRGEAERRFPGAGAERASEDYGVFEMLLSTPQAAARGLTLDALRRMDAIDRLAWRWVLFNEKGVDDVEGLPSCRVVRYEDVCADPVGRAREMLEHAGLDWHPQTEAFVRTSVSRDSRRYYSVFRDPVRAATAWKTELPERTARRVMDVLVQSRLKTFYHP
jgi:hypothetical protein